MFYSFLLKELWYEYLGVLNIITAILFFLELLENDFIIKKKSNLKLSTRDYITLVLIQNIGIQYIHYVP